MQGLMRWKRRSRVGKGSLKYDAVYLQSEDYLAEARERFEALFSLDSLRGCWLWEGSKCNRKGYGKFWFRGGVKAAHRVSYELYNGAIPDGLHILHSCDVTSCVNPAHLRPGTNAENHREKMERGRNVSPRGEASGMAKLTEREVVAIYKLTQTARSGRQIAADFGVRPSTVCAIKSGYNWSWLTGKCYNPKRRTLNEKESVCGRKNARV